MQQLLLTAALTDRLEATTAWQRWLLTAEETTFDVGSQRLAPLVYKNLTKHGVDHPHLSRFKGLYRRTWYSNQQLLRRCESILELFRKNGVPTMLMKGIPLSLTVYRDLGVRPMDDIDLAIPADRAALATKILIEAGWLPDDPVHQVRADRQVAATFRAQDGTQLDLHFSLFHEILNNAHMEIIWRRAVPITLVQTQSLAPCVEDQLLHTMAHGLRSNALPPIRWIADAVSLIRSDASLDWTLLLREAHELQLSLVLQRALKHLSDHYACVPPDVLTRISKHKPTRLERFEFYVGRTVRIPLVVLVQYARLNPRLARPSFALGFLRFMQDKWQTATLAATLRRLTTKWLRAVLRDHHLNAVSGHELRRGKHDDQSRPVEVSKFEGDQA